MARGIPEDKQAEHHKVEDNGGSSLPGKRKGKQSRVTYSQRRTTVPLQVSSREQDSRERQVVGILEVKNWQKYLKQRAHGHFFRWYVLQWHKPAVAKALKQKIAVKD